MRHTVNPHDDPPIKRRPARYSGAPMVLTQHRDLQTQSVRTLCTYTDITANLPPWRGFPPA
jgi:hypothetical protein